MALMDFLPLKTPLASYRYC